jgi:hypothetical protein
MMSVARRERTDVSRADEPRLRGKMLLAVRGIWIALVAVNLVSFITSVPGYFATLQRACRQTCTFLPQQAKALAALGISMSAYAWMVVALACVVVLISLAMALLLFWRRSDDWMALIIAFSLLALPAGNLSTLAASDSAPIAPLALTLIALLLSLPAYAAYYGNFLLFPSGRFAPRWSWILLIAWLLFIIVIKVQPGESGVLSGLLDVGYPLLYGAAILCQVYRYRSVSNTIQRQQTKLVVVGLIASLLANQLFWQTGRLDALSATVYGPFALLLYQATLLLLPLAFFLAIQRYRLYDIDVLIRRTLVYGSLTVILAGIYIAGVVGLQSLLNAVVTARSGASFAPPIIVLTTLLIAALFQPLRQRIQQAVDRRFYRSKYDAHRAIEQFGASLRQQVDLPALTSQLVGVVQETMEPSNISLWLSERSKPLSEQPSS